MSADMPRCEIIIASALQKIFPDRQPSPNPAELSVLHDDVVSFQVAVRLDWRQNLRAHISIDSPLLPWLHVRELKLSPSAYPAPPSIDAYYERTAPGMFPDRLSPLEDNCFKLVAGQFRALWLDVEPDAETPGGTHPIRIAAHDDEGREFFCAEVLVEVVPVRLPKSDICHAEWFHADCPADYYRVPVFSERHFEIVSNFIRLAVRRGINTILTPLFTYPLDTAEGGERTTIQLIGVSKRDESYSFDFSLLRRWVSSCKKCGVEYFEMSHLFSQWGAKYAPKIMANVYGIEKRIFGWHTPGDSPEYARFLATFLPALDIELRALGIAERCFFHVSDEPEAGDIERYARAKELLKKSLPGYHIIDALSDFAFYQTGAVERPIPAIDHLMPFIDAGVPDLWTYYCCAQTIDVSNCFFSMPSARNRVLGLQLYKYNIKGFLHWGFNFYNAQFSRKHIDPYAVTDADEAFPSGDAFLVYPGADGQPEESLRLMVLDQAFNDVRALKLLEELSGKEQVLAMINEGLEKPLTLTEYPHAEEYYLHLRAKINRAIRDIVLV